MQVSLVHFLMSKLVPIMYLIFQIHLVMNIRRYLKMIAQFSISHHNCLLSNLILREYKNYNTINILELLIVPKKGGMISSSAGEFACHENLVPCRHQLKFVFILQFYKIDFLLIRLFSFELILMETFLSLLLLRRWYFHLYQVGK